MKGYQNLRLVERQTRSSVSFRWETNAKFSLRMKQPCLCAIDDLMFFHCDLSTEKVMIES